VEYFHHCREVAEVLEELRGECESNERSYTNETADYRWKTAELENNLMVLDYFHKSYGTPEEKLPGSLVWFHWTAGHSQDVWDAAKTSGVTSMMPREEVQGFEGIYNQLRRIDDARARAWESRKIMRRDMNSRIPGCRN